MANHFIWADLSTSDTKKAKSFYSACFDWRYYKDSASPLHYCLKGKDAVAAIYKMPDKFQRLNLPSFWMSYIQVEDIERTTKLATKYGAKLEVGPETQTDGSIIALIRDPLGAGFTCYQAQSTENTKQSSFWHELHISDLSKVKDFYTQVFNWVIEPSDKSNEYVIYHEDGSAIASMQVIDNTIKGTNEYWIIYFSVADIEHTKSAITANGGEILYPSENGASLLARDNQGAAFYISQM